MPIVGSICGQDGSFQSFDRCIQCHENFTSVCHVPVEVLKIGRDNHIERKDAGWSATTLTGCARATALLEVYDYYEPIQSIWNKARGTLHHAMMEYGDPDPPEGVVREQRIYREVSLDGVNVRVTGKPDKVYTKHGVLIDFKSKHKLPITGKGVVKRQEDHEAQFNIYVWLLANGRLLLTNEPICVTITRGGMHYMTWDTKEGTQFLKVNYPLWELEDTEAFVLERLAPLVVWRKTKNLPRCNQYVKGYWDCDCVKITKQLTTRGIKVEEHHG